MTKLWLAPMELYTDLSYRLLCKKYGADYTITEMTNAIAISRNIEKVMSKIYTPKSERAEIQVMAQNKPEYYTGIIKINELIETNQTFPSKININMGCPAPKIIGSEAGSFVLKDLKMIKEIVTKTIKLSSIPVSCKIRLGYNTQNHLEISKTIENAGAVSLIVHGRTVKQKYSGNADWEAIQEINEQINIQVIGNGDITNLTEAKDKLKITNNGVMIGRAAQGNPHLFKGQERTTINQIKLFNEYVKLNHKHKINLNLNRLKIQALAFSKGITGAKQIRTIISQSKSNTEIINAFNSLSDI